MLTVRDALAMPVLAQAELVAGAAGLDTAISWVHIVDFPGASYEYQRRGILLLTAGYGLRDDPDAQRALVAKLVEQGYAGMLLSVGFVFDAVPPALVEAAEHAGFPLIATPRHVMFISITEAVLAEIINLQYGLLQASNDINARLTGLVLEGKNLGDLADTLSALLNRSVSIEDPQLRVLAAAIVGPIDEARKRSIAARRTTTALAAHLLESGIYDRLKETMAPVRVPPIPDMGMDLERVVAPIIVGHELFGYIWIIADDEGLSPLDDLAIQHGSTVAALMLFKQKEVHAAQALQRQGLFEQLLTAELITAEMAEQARRLDFRIDLPCHVLIVRGVQRVPGGAVTLGHDLSQWLAASGYRTLHAWRDEGLVLLLPCDDRATVETLARRLVAELSHPALRLLVAVGPPARLSETGEPNGTGSPLTRSYEQALETIRIARRLGATEGVYAFRALGMAHWLYHLPAEHRASNAWMDVIQALVEHDERRNSELLDTLEAYLKHGGALVPAADALFVHRNTLIHRLDRISAITELDLREPETRFNLYAALLMHRLTRTR